MDDPGRLPGESGHDVRDTQFDDLPFPVWSG
jgi:hypothetical protein